MRKMHYLDVSLELSQRSDQEVTHIYLKKNVLQAVRQLFGEEGAKSTIDILKFDPATLRFILRCSSYDYVRLRAALTFATKYEGHTCVYIVHRVSPNLLSFIADSRTYEH
ncbi:PREDICTED: ribonuclease P protein subunit p14 [Dinoponera quadriceps]|uniref:Ribonuclease P protein subunit p14 n=1 Tax=Dinoponera quadriceps TaxID=609295 RepID=A0A6P3XH96_DINQU|nr:PREDICTED: ribonuclease P protein subunit p14 [Dinoponera quadriceps]